MPLSVGTILIMSKPSKKFLVSILVPAYNEQETIEAIVKQIIAIKNIRKEIVIVNDGSTDDTGVIAQKLAKKYKTVQTFHHRTNKGKGAAVKTALGKSKGEIIITQDADLEYSPKDYLKLLKPFEDNNIKVVYGTREKIARKGIYSNVFFYLGGEFLTLLANLLYGINISDEATGYKLFRREVLEKIKLKSKGFEFCPEVTAKVANLGFEFTEVPISYSPRPFSSGKKIRPIDGLIAIKTLFKHSFLFSSSSSALTAGLEITKLAKNYNRWILKKIAPYIKGVILEAGAGIGTMADLLLNSQHTKLILGEIRPSYIKNLRNKYLHLSSVKVSKLDISSSRSVAKLKNVQTVITINTLEHIKNDQQAIINLSNTLVKGGHLIIFVPAFQIIFSNWDKSIGHFRRYNKGQLTEKVENAGLQPVSSKYINLPGFFGWWVNKLLENTPKNKSVQKQILLFDRFILPWWSKLEDNFNLPIGQSLIMIAKKVK